MPPSWQSIAAEKKASQQAAIPKEWIIKVPGPDVLDVTSLPDICGLLSAKELEITNADVDDLLPKLASAEWSSVEVTTAFYKRAIVAQQAVNCLTEIFIEKALARASELDERLKTTGKVVGPLHGLPISLKDQINIKDLESTMGYISWIGVISDKNAVVVDILLAAGAVPFVKTNIPQTLMWPETFNHIFGRTSNPHNRNLTSGGSSGGEGALIAMRGSPLGVGSDIGGSVRIPAAFCGIYGLRPSYGRVPYAGCVNSLEGQDSVLSVLGPLSQSISGIKLFLQAVISQQPWLHDPLVVRKRWNEEEYKLADHGLGKELCFGILWNDGVTIPHPPILRALEMTKKALLAAGHKVVDWEPLNHHEIYDTILAIWAAGAAEDYAVVTSPTGEPLIASMSPEAESEGSPKAAFRPKDGDPKVTAYELWRTHKRRRDLREAYLAHWNATTTRTGTGRPVDAIISPIAPYAAPPHGKNKSADYTMVWNMLDYPALVIPVTKVDPEIDAKSPPHSFLNSKDKENYPLYDPALFKNAPVSIQVVGRTLEEEAVIGVSEIVDAALKAAGSSAKL